jgi:hypothetical protein
LSHPGPLIIEDPTMTVGTPASSTTKTGRHDIAEILLKVALKHQKSNQIKYIMSITHTPKCVWNGLLSFGTLYFCPVCCPITGSRWTWSIPGVRDNRGAGPGSYSPFSFFKNVLLAILWRCCGASSGSKIGLKQASGFLHH